MASLRARWWMPNGINQSWNRRFSGMSQVLEAHGFRQTLTRISSRCQWFEGEGRWKTFGKMFQRACSTRVERRLSQSSRPDPWQRSQNLQVHGEDNAKHDLAVREVMSLLQGCEDLEVVKLGEMCHVNLVVRNPGSELGLGLSVKATKTKASNTFYFSRCRKSSSVLNICIALPSLVNKSFLWWVVPGEHLCDRRSGTLCIRRTGKWSSFEVRPERIADVVLMELGLRIAHQLPLSVWSLPNCEEHQKEQELLLQMNQKVFTPLGSKLEDPETERCPIDLIVDNIRVQNKTASPVKGQYGLRLNTYKQNGRVNNGRVTVQPYSVDDGIDAIIVNVHEDVELIGLFIFPKEEIVTRGWFRGNDHPGKVTALVYPPYISPRKGRGSAQKWQLDYYLDVSKEVGRRASMLKTRPLYFYLHKKPPKIRKYAPTKYLNKNPNRGTLPTHPLDYRKTDTKPKHGKTPLNHTPEHQDRVLSNRERFREGDLDRARMLIDRCKTGATKNR